MHAADGVAPTGNSASSYPHQFKNKGKNPIVFPRPECNTLKAGHFLLEYPLKRRSIYNQNAKPKPDPGPTRVIYIGATKTFCGVISHLGDGTYRNKGDFALCERRPKKL
ncbi:hypothetical protein Ae201684P_006797 [Aphanomyces euteiches]|nr:hypothetical protein Ae201684P_006797 [Aphanomyces euteiches]